MSRRNLSNALICCALLLAAVFMLPSQAWAETAEADNWEALCKSLCHPDYQNGTVVLSGDIVWSEHDGGVAEVLSGQTITLDLAGHTIDRGLSEGDPDEAGYVIINKGTLTIIDSVGGGKITGGNMNGDGGGIVNSGTLILNGGAITGNKATSSGGGIFNSGTLTVNGGSITGNTAAHQGGGILQNGTMNVSGAPIVQGDTAPNGDNIYLRSAHPTMNVTGAMNDGACLYVTSANGTATFTNGYGTYHTEKPVKYFHADSAGHGVILDSGEAKIEGGGLASNVSYLDSGWTQGYRLLLFYEEMITRPRSKTTLCRGGYHPPEKPGSENASFMAWRISFRAGG